MNKQYFIYTSLVVFLLSTTCGTAQIVSQKIGNNPTMISASAILEVESANKGVLIPRIELSSTTDATTINAPATSLLVYNTATLGTAPNNVTPGFYYWNGTLWVRIAQDNSILYDGTKAYTTSDIVEKDKKLYRPNASIPANTTFAIGTTGATWYEISATETAKVLAGAVGDANKLTKLGSDGQTITKTGITEDASGNVVIGNSSFVGNEKVNITFNSSGSVTQALNTKDANASANDTSHIVLRKSDDAYLGALGRAGEDTAMFVDGSSYLALRTGNTERMRIDANGNLGIGVTPSAWGTSGNARAIQMGATALSSFSDSRGELLTNAFNNGTNYIYRVNYPAVSYSQEANTGAHKWYTAPSGTAGDPINFNQAMTLDANQLTVASGNIEGLDNLNLSALNSDTNGTVVDINSKGTVGVIKMSTNNTERMRIDSSGKVGIGTSNLESILNIAWASNKGIYLSDGVLAGIIYNIDNSMTIGTSTNHPLAFYINNTERMRIAANGNVGIGNDNPSYKLDVNGDIRGSNVTPTSDIRLKNNITKIENGLDIIKKLNPVAYEKKGALEDTEYKYKENGFIAQEIREIMPNLVSEDKSEDKILSLNYNGIIPVLTKAIQEQQEQIEILKREIKLLKSKK